jgi:hypothetical protein
MLLEHRATPFGRDRRGWFLAFGDFGDFDGSGQPYADKRSIPVALTTA